MYSSVFTDELYKNSFPAMSIISQWGVSHVDFRSRVNGKPISGQTKEELIKLKTQLNDLGLEVGVLQSSLCKIQLPSAEIQKKEFKKLDGIIRAADLLGCRLVRAFNFWQHEPGDSEFGQLSVRPDEMSKVLEMMDPFFRKAKDEGLILGFENCGQTPDEIISLLDALNVDGWGMAWDVANYFDVLPEAQGDYIDYFEKCLKHSNMIHVKANSILPEIEVKNVPWDRVLNGVAATGKDIPISIETHNPSGSIYTHEEATYCCVKHIQKVWPSQAPTDIRSALAIKEQFKRPYDDDPVRMVVVGLGMGKVRAQQIIETSGTNLVGVCDIDKDKARQVGEQLEVSYSEDIQVFLNDPSVEVMYVVTPTGSHSEVAIQCLNAGKHVLLTKPMDVNTVNCDKAIALARAKGLMLGLDFDMHFLGPLNELKEAVKKDYFGEILHYNVSLNVCRTDEYYQSNGGWRGTWKHDGGGSLSNQGIHEVDRMLTVLGIPKRVKAIACVQYHDIESEDFASAQWEYERGCIANISTTTSYQANTWYARIEIHGTKGAYVLNSGGPEGDHIYWFSNGGKWTEETPFPVKNKWRQASDQFAYSLRLGVPLVLDYKPGILSRMVLDCMYESAKNNNVWIKIPKDAKDINNLQN